MAQESSKPCFKFLRGKCGKGPSCDYSHDQPLPVCRFYQTRNGCRKGSSCSYLHEGAAKNQDTSPFTKTPITKRTAPTESEKSFREWLFLIPRPNIRSQRVDLATFFQSGWEIMAMENVEMMQQVVKKLASEEGLNVVKALTDNMSQTDSTDTTLRTFENCSLPFFRILSHPRVMSSLILETLIDTLFNFLYGPSGRRAISIFRHTVTALALLLLNDSAKEQASFSMAVTPSLAVLEKIVELNQGAQLITELQTIVTDFFEIIPEESLTFGKRSLARIRQRLGLGAAMPWAQHHNPESIDIKPVFDLGHDFPGELSDSGPRHDNDHAQISDIKILPTSEEILSLRLEYLPSNKPSEHHLAGMAGSIDRQFRLLREDNIGKLRDAVRIEYDRLCRTGSNDSPARRRNDMIRTAVYQKVRLQSFQFQQRQGLQLLADFIQPPQLRQKGAKEREEWWGNSKLLQTDAFVCLVSSKGYFIFCSVCDPSQTFGPKKVKEEDNNNDQSGAQWRDSPPSLFGDPLRASLTLSPVEDDLEDISWLHKHLGSNFGIELSLVEFPGVLLPAFQPTLKALQTMSVSLDLPFSEFITPDTQSSGCIDVPMPAYACKPGFSFNLETLVGGEELRLIPGQPFDYDKLRLHSSLDEAQQKSTVNAFCRSLALIQGPPGTGKSYTGVAIIKALLSNREEATLGPIVCVCYTNHALDQLLEHLHKDGVKQIIRVGTRSKSQVLEDLNLHKISMNADRTKFERYEQGLVYAQLDMIYEELDRLIVEMRNAGHWTNVRAFLERQDSPFFYRLFSRDVDDDGFQEVKGKTSQSLNIWLRGGKPDMGPPRPVAELIRAGMGEMSLTERQSLYAHWIEEITSDLDRQLLNLLDSYNELRNKLRSLHSETDLRCLMDAHVIGITTTGLARKLDILRRVRAKVVVFEEAGEVLEAHTLTALLPSVEHAILIGDHEQLRPQINNYDFQHDNPRGAKYSLDVSLFERLVHPQSGHLELPYSSLNIQRRMHPSIAELVRSTLYPWLQDHSAVASYPEVVGMRKRLFWLDHREKEDAEASNVVQSFSKTNAWEVEMVASLVHHLVQQGTYGNEDIAVLTPYLGQLQMLKRRLRSSFAIVVGDRDQEELENTGLMADEEGNRVNAKAAVHRTTLLNALRIATVDNFQGEEAEVIIVSLVRSNEERKCGFLKTSNRINVLLSRARHGMYVIGNAETARSIPMWDQVITSLEEGDKLGQSLALCCPRHEEIAIEVSKPDDFSILSPEGGCNRKCVDRLSCGHACVNKCHAKPLHEAVRCLERCPRVKKGCEHACPKVCGDQCDAKCQIKVPGIQLPCGHVQEWLKCHLAQAPEEANCPTLVEAAVPGCNHSVKVPCYRLPFRQDYVCGAICNDVLVCGHNCKDLCKNCNERDEDNLSISKSSHKRCSTVCRRPYTLCNHSCPSPCHGDEPCPPCNAGCEVRCAHSQCSRKCHEPCVPCVEACSWSCPHRGECELPCAVPCDMLPCSKRCSLALTCGHQCPSVCGEMCPDARYCQTCAKQPIKDIVVDYIMMETYTEVDLDQNPCIIPSCGHILTLGSMDGHMDLSQYYEIAEDSNSVAQAVALKSRSTPFSGTLKNCPQCRGPLRNINRYGRIVRRAWVDEATKKFIVWANSNFSDLNLKLTQREAELRDTLADGDIPKDLAWRRGPDSLSSQLSQLSIQPLRLVGSRDEQIATVRTKFIGKSRYKSILGLRKELSRFLLAVDEGEQPIGRIHDLVEDARRHSGVRTNVVDLPVMLQVHHRLLASVLLLRCDYSVLFDVVARRIEEAAGGNAPDTVRDLASNRKDCETLARDARDRHSPRERVEALLYWARFAALERGHSDKLSDTDMFAVIEQARHKLQLARNVCTQNRGSTQGLLEEVSHAEKMLQDATFYQPVTNAEKAAVYAAMAAGFSGTGHWYYCVNGHPFTVGECGMPMQTARCPQCGAQIGGQNHVAVEGVRRAADYDAL